MFYPIFPFFCFRFKLNLLKMAKEKKNVKLNSSLLIELFAGRKRNYQNRLFMLSSVHRAERRGLNEEDVAVFKIRIRLPSTDDG